MPTGFPESDKKEEQRKIAKLGPISVSLLLHVLVLSLIGGAVVVEKVIPKSIFQTTTLGENFDQQQAEQALPDAEELQDPGEAMDLQMPADSMAPVETSAPVDDMMVDVLSTTSTIASFNVTPSLSPGNMVSSSSQGRSKGSSLVGFKSPSGKASSVNFFNIKAEARRVAFLLDASGSMVLQQRGGGTAYAKLKEQLVQMVNGLDETTEFNVYIFDSAVDVYMDQAASATKENKEKFASWIAPYMSTKMGNITKNLKTDRLKGYQGLTRMDLAIVGAMESGCDTVFILTDGTPSVSRPPTEKELAEWQKVADKNAKEIEQYWTAAKEYQEKYKDLIAEMKQEVEKRNAALQGRQSEWIYSIPGYKGLPQGPVAPPGTWKPKPRLTQDEIVEMVRGMSDELYKPQGMEPPSIHIVGYMVNDEDRNFLRQIARSYKGKYEDFKAPK